MRGSFYQQADDLDLPGEAVPREFCCLFCEINYLLEWSDAIVARAYCSKECEAADQEEGD